MDDAAGSTPLWDPERDLAAVPGAPGWSGSRAGLVRAAFAGVDARVVAERALLPGALLPVVSMLDRAAEPVLRRRVSAVVGCLERVVECYPNDDGLRDYLEVPHVLRRWVLRGGRRERLRVDFCRLDLLGTDLDSVRVSEFNPSSPGGAVVAGIVNREWRRSPVGALLAEWGTPCAPVEGPTWFADWLFAYGRERGVSDADARRVALVRGVRRSRFEVDALTAQFTASGGELIPVDAADAAASAGFAPAYPKYVPTVAAAEVERWAALCERLSAGDLVAPNPLGARWVAENKLSLAVLSDPRFRYLFTPAQHAACDALVPRSRKLGGVSPAEAVAGRRDLVLKAPYGYRGQAVHLGIDTDARTWSDPLRDPARRGWLVQERVVPAHVDTHEGRYFRDLKVPVLRGRVIGYASRMGRAHLLNGALGNAVAAVYAPHDLDTD
ncbi:hypothetical protein [Embleya sp. NPDC001921]